MLVLCSVTHYIEKNIDPERVGSFFGKLVEEIGVFAFTLPAVAVVAVVGRDHHDLVFVVQDRANMHFPTIFAAAVLVHVMGFPSDARVLGANAVTDAGGLEFVLGNLEVEYTMEYRMLH